MMDDTENGEILPASAEDKKPAVSFKSVNWNRLFGYLKPYRGRMALAMLALLFSSGFGLAFPLVIVRLLDSVTKAKDFGPLNLLAGVLVAMFLLQSAFTFVQSYLLSYIGERIVYDLRTSLYRHLQALSLDFYATRRVGDLVSRLSSDVTQMRTMLTSNLTTLLSQVIGLVGSVIILLTLNARLTLFILGLVPLLVAIAFFFGRHHPQEQHQDPGSAGRFHRGRRRGPAGHPRGQELRAGRVRNPPLRHCHGKDLPCLPQNGRDQFRLLAR